MELERQLLRHKDAVYRQMVRTCGNHEDAEDALADALLAAIKASEQLKEPANFQAWLARIGTRACIRSRIRERLLQTISLFDLESRGFEVQDVARNPLTEAEQSALKSCVSGAIDLLPPIYRDVYLQREILGEKAEVVALNLNISIPAVKSRLFRAREMMRESLDTGLGCRQLVDSET